MAFHSLGRTFLSFNVRRCSAMLRAVSTAASSEKLVVTEKLGKVMLIGINRPEKRNCVNPETAQQLVKAFKNFEKDDDSLVAILHGKGGTFCAGYDLKSLSEGDPSSLPEPPDSGSDGAMGPTRMAFSKPVIAAVSGYAVAGGLELALMCDLRVVEESAIMGVFCRRFGVPLLDGGTVRLPKLIGLSRALDLILTGRPITATEALNFGLANRVVATGTAVGQAMQLANNLLKFPQLCMRLDRQSAYNAAFDAPSMTEALQYEYVNGIKVVSEESIQGASKFTQGVGKGGNFNITQPPHTKSKL